MNYKSEKKKLLEFGKFAGAICAGGAITSVFTNKPINDIDLYFKSKDDFSNAVESAYDDGLWCVDVSARSVTFVDGGRVVQFMHFKFFDDVSDIFNSFDFTICMGAYEYSAGEFKLHDDFMRHNSQKFLKFNSGTDFPLASATRVLKYQDRGYTIGKGEVLKIALSCKKIEINSWDDLKNQIGGAYGEKVIINSAGLDFSLDAAIEVLSIDDELLFDRDTSDQPSNAIELLKKIEEMKGDENEQV